MNTLKNTDGEDQFDANNPLSSLNGKSPFKVDDSYFDDFAAKLNHAISDLEELKEEAPILISIPKYNPFEVPAGYFDELPSIIQEKAATREKDTLSLKEWIIQLLKPNFVFPVAVIIIIAIAAIHVVDKQQPLKKDFTADFSLEDQLYAIDESLLVDLLSKNDSKKDIAQSSIDDRISTYLIDNNVDEAVLNIDDNTIDHENQ